MRVALVAVLVAVATLQQPPADVARCAPAPGWTPLASPDDYRTWAILAPWRRDRTLYVGGYLTTYRSDDCGQSWSVVDFGKYPGTDIPIERDGSAWMASDPSGRIYLNRGNHLGVRSDDGETWTVMGCGYLRKIVASQRLPGRAFAWFDKFSMRGCDGLMFTEDAGLSWTPILNTNPEDIEIQSTSRSTLGIASVDTASESAVYYFADRLLYRVEYDLVAYVSANVQRLQVLPTNVTQAVVSGSTPARLWAATDDGRLRMSTDGGHNWAVIDTPFRGHVVNMSIVPSDPSLLWMVTSNSEIWAYRDTMHGSPPSATPAAAPAQVPSVPDRAR
ncbi:MAG: hypothetical protein U0821_25275 [Chloroflexota bacterium]